MILAVITAAHIAALGMLESGNDDAAVGKKGERTRFQMMPNVIAHYPDLAKDPTNAKLAEKYTLQEWSHRIFHFEAEFNRVPTVKEIALLWHCPARVLHPNAEERGYAERFSNLFDSACMSCGVTPVKP